MAFSLFMMKTEISFLNQNLKRENGFGPCILKTIDLPTALIIKEEGKKARIVIVPNN